MQLMAQYNPTFQFSFSCNTALEEPYVKAPTIGFSVHPVGKTALILLASCVLTTMLYQKGENYRTPLTYTNTPVPQVYMPSALIAPAIVTRLISELNINYLKAPHSSSGK